MVARRTPRRIPQPAFRPMGRLDDGDALNLSRAEIAEYFARRTQSTQRKAALRFRQLRPLAGARRVRRSQKQTAVGSMSCLFLRSRDPLLAQSASSRKGISSRFLLVFSAPFALSARDHSPISARD